MLTIQLTEEQAQRAVKFLAKASYEEVADIIDDIKHQASNQIIQQDNMMRVAMEEFEANRKERAKKIAEEAAQDGTTVDDK